MSFLEAIYLQKKVGLINQAPTKEASPNCANKLLLYEWKQKTRPDPLNYITAIASISTFTSLGKRATWTAARAGYGALKNSP